MLQNSFMMMLNRRAIKIRRRFIMKAFKWRRKGNLLKVRIILHLTKSIWLTIKNLNSRRSLSSSSSRMRLKCKKPSTRKLMRFRALIIQFLSQQKKSIRANNKYSFIRMRRRRHYKSMRNIKGKQKYKISRAKKI